MAVIGYAVNLGSQAISLAVSFKTAAASRQIPGVESNLHMLRTYSFQYYAFAMSFVIMLSAMFLKLWYTVVQLLSGLNIKTPFTFEVSRKMESIAYWLLAIWIVGFVGEKFVDWVSKRMGQDLDVLDGGNELLFTAGIVYIVSQIFKHGIEMQEENLQTI